MTEREALKLALEALEEPKEHIAKHRRLDAITAIKEALAQPEQEPLDEWSEWRSMVVVNLIRHGDIDKDFARRLAYFYQSKAPQRTWVGLTDEEVKDCFKITPDQHLPWHIYQRIEAKLKEKNT